MTPTRPPDVIRGSSPSSDVREVVRVDATERSSRRDGAALLAEERCNGSGDRVGVLHRQEVIETRELADARGWEVHLYDGKDVEGQAARILGAEADQVLYGPRATLGPPWGKDQRVALAATVIASPARLRAEQRRPSRPP